MEKYRSRTHMLLLYPDNIEHLSVIERIKKSYDYAIVLHDRDTWTDADELKNPEHKAGTVKKPHYHCVIRFNQAKWNTAISSELSLDVRFIEETKKFDNALEYLMHRNDSDKVQYSIDEVCGPLVTKLREIISKTDKSEGEKVVELIQYIRDLNCKLSVIDFAEFCALNGYWSEFRRSGSIFCRIIDENNSKFDTNKIVQ